MARPSVAPTPPSKSSRPPPKPPSLSPEDALANAMAAETPALRAKHARLGLATRARIDRTTHTMLLRQLYMAHFERRRFRKSLEVIEQALELRVMMDVVHQDAARACLALQKYEEAVGHLRLAARRGPASRRAFHLWTLGATLMNLGRYADAAAALERAARWGTTDRPLYAAHAMLAKALSGTPVVGARAVYERLAKAPCGQGYGRFVLGILSFHMRHWDESRELLESFVERTSRARPAMQISLTLELAMAEATLNAMRVVN